MKTRGKKHDYIGMVLDFSIPGMVEIAMKEYAREIIGESKGDMSGTSPIPAGIHLFSLNTTNTSYLNESDVQHLHHIVAKIYFCTKDQDQTFRQQWLFSLQGSRGQIKTITRNWPVLSNSLEEHQKLRLSYAHVAQMR